MILMFSVNAPQGRLLPLLNEHGLPFGDGFITNTFRYTTHYVYGYQTAQYLR